MKPIGSSNVAIAEIHLNSGIAFCAGATSKGGRKSLIGIPKPKSLGGQFEPEIETSYLFRSTANVCQLLDSIAEYQSGKLVPQRIEELRQELDIGG